MKPRALWGVRRRWAPQLEVRTERLPVSAQGKILKTELRKQFWGDRVRNVS